MELRRSDNKAGGGADADNGHKYQQMELDPSQKLLVDTRSSGRSDFDVGFQL